MKYLVLLFVLFMASCAGPLWDGEPRNASDTIDVTFIIDNPFYLGDLNEGD